MAKVADAGENQLLHRVRQSPICRIGGEGKGIGDKPNLSFGDIFGTSDPVDIVAQLLDCIHQTPNVASNVIQEVNGGHPALSMFCCCCTCWATAGFRSQENCAEERGKRRVEG